MKSFNFLKNLNQLELILWVIGLLVFCLPLANFLLVKSININFPVYTYEYLTSGGVFYQNSFLKLIYILVLVLILYYSITIKKNIDIKKNYNFSYLYLFLIILYYAINQDKLSTATYILSIILYILIININYFNKLNILLIIPIFIVLKYYLDYLNVVPILEPIDFFFSADFHLNNLLSPAIRLLDGYSWITEIRPSYGLLMPELMFQSFRLNHFTFEAAISFLQICQLIIFVLFAFAMYFRVRSMFYLLLILPILFIYHPSILQIFTPNHGAWRYMGIGLTFFTLSFLVFVNIRPGIFIKSLLSCAALLFNFETGLIITFAIIYSEIKSKYFSRLKLVLLLLLTSTIFCLFFYAITDTNPLIYLGKYILNGAVNNAAGGEKFKTFPVFIVIVIHCGIVIWRISKSKISTPKNEFDFICAFYCLCWLIYFVNRSSSTYLLPIFIPYTLLLHRLSRDFIWIFGSKFVGVLISVSILSYSLFYFDQISKYNEWIHVGHLKTQDVRKMPVLKNVNASGDELVENFQKGDGYISPFSFYHRGVTFIPNNLITPDPFSIPVLDSEYLEFINSDLPKRIFLPNSTPIFSPGAAPISYLKFIDNLQLDLSKRGYRANKILEFWTLYTLQ